MTLTDLKISDLILNQIEEDLKFRYLQRGVLRLRKTSDDGISAVVEVLDENDTVIYTKNFNSTDSVWRVTL